MGRDHTAAAPAHRAQDEHQQAIAMLLYDATMLRTAAHGPAAQPITWDDVHQLWHELHDAGLLADRPDEAATSRDCAG